MLRVFTNLNCFEMLLVFPSNPRITSLYPDIRQFKCWGPVIKVLNKVVMDCFGINLFIWWGATILGPEKKFKSMGRFGCFVSRKTSRMVYGLVNSIKTYYVSLYEGHTKSEYIHSEMISMLHSCITTRRSSVQMHWVVGAFTVPAWLLSGFSRLFLQSQSMQLMGLV